MVLIISRGDTNRIRDCTLKGFMGICGSQRMPYSLLRVPVTDKRIDPSYLHLNLARLQVS